MYRKRAHHIEYHDSCRNKPENYSKILIPFIWLPTNTKPVLFLSMQFWLMNILFLTLPLLFHDITRKYYIREKKTLNFKIHLRSSKFPQGFKHIIRFGKPGWPVSCHLSPVSNPLIPTLSHLPFFPTHIQLSLQLLFLNVSWNSRLPFAFLYIFRQP